jgi:very-short-patch-repair endonuclease
MAKSRRFSRQDVVRLSPIAQKELEAQLYPAGGCTDTGTGLPAKRARRKIAAQSFMGSLPEYRFHPTRKFRFDHAWPDKKLAMEIDGGLYVNGGHSRGAAREHDYEKDAEALMLGWRVLRVSRGQFRDGHAAYWITKLLSALA